MEIFESIKKMLQKTYFFFFSQPQVFGRVLLAYQRD
jgi:hypothetical protein